MKSSHFYYMALTGYFGLFFLLMLWYTVLAPSLFFPVTLSLLIMITPLLLPLRGVLHARPKSCAWAAFLSLLYFTHGSIEAYVDPEHRFLAIAEIIFSLLLFLGASFYLHALKKQPKS
ncbi:MAG: DUF2069 domain-containing protein [Methylococcales bacterium]|nr:DUF2069 domain-containing protein [Methylococcales bacterium]